jgi:D-threo-aldose 1-dehydrogenase
MQNEKTAGVNLPRIILGTSSLGNLFVALDDETRLAIVREYIESANGPVVFDSAGKYGAGLALEVLGNCLRKLNVAPAEVVISNKLGWIRSELKTVEPTFEPGVWKDLKHDAVQKISYDGIMECFEQGNDLLAGYIPKMVSVHDPDEYMVAAADAGDAEKRYADILEAYQALFDLKKQGKVEAVGVGAKNWKMIQRISSDVDLDWIMIANSLTVKSHPEDLLEFISTQSNQGVSIINSAVFHSGFLVGGDYYDYKLIKSGTPENDALLKWRMDFFALCSTYQIKPAAACVQFALQLDGVGSLALSTTNPARIKTNLRMVRQELPSEFWYELKTKGLVSIDLTKSFLNK